jgi:hypothetical protein
VVYVNIYNNLHKFDKQTKILYKNEKNYINHSSKYITSIMLQQQNVRWKYCGRRTNSTSSKNS